MATPADRRSGAVPARAGQADAAGRRIATDGAQFQDGGGVDVRDTFTRFNRLLIEPNMISGLRNLRGSVVSQ